MFSTTELSATIFPIALLDLVDDTRKLLEAPPGAIGYGYGIFYRDGLVLSNSRGSVTGHSEFYIDSLGRMLPEVSSVADSLLSRVNDHSLMIKVVLTEVLSKALEEFNDAPQKIASKRKSVEPPTPQIPKPEVIPLSLN